MKRQKKRFLTLIELMISLALAMLVLSFALYFYRYAVFTDERLKQEEAKVVQERLLSGRLTSVFARLKDKPFRSVPEVGGLTKGESLIFSYENDSYAPTYHGPVLARLFVDPENRLILAIWSYNRLSEPDVIGPVHLEVLFEGVDTFFLDYLVGGGEEKTRQGSLRPGQFINEWKNEYETVPAAIRFRLNGKLFAFPLASCKEAI